MGTVARNGLCYNGRNLEEVHLILINMNSYHAFAKDLIKWQK